MSNKVPLAQATKESRKLKSVAKPKDMILDPMGQWKHPGENTRIPSNNITMEGVPYPVLAKPNVGQPVMMQPGAHYTFPGADYVDEFPKFAGGGMVEATVDENGEPKCPDGYDYNSATGYCEKKSSKCPNGYKPDGKGGCIEDRCQPGYEKDASGNCVPDTSGAVYVEDENDPRYQDYLTRRKLNHISNIENPEIRRNAYYNMKKGYDKYDQFYDPEKGYTFDNIKTEDGRTVLFGKDGYPVTTLDNIDPNKGDYDSKRDIYKGLTIDQARDLEAYARSKGFDMGNQFDPYSDSDYEPDQFTEKYKPSKFDANVYYINSVTPNFSFDRSTGKYLQPNTAIVEDKINRGRLKKYYPNITDEDINYDYAHYYNSYISNIKDDYNSLWPQYSADPELAEQIDVLAADDGSDITMDEHKKNIQDSAEAPSAVSAPLNVKYNDNGNPIIKGRRTSYKPDLVQDWINSTGRVVPYYDAPTDNYKFVTQPKSAELIQETQRAVPKFDDPELNLKKSTPPKFSYFGPLTDRKHIRYDNPFIVGTSNRPLNWAPYSAALRAFTGYKKGAEKEYWKELKAAREEGRPIDFKGIPLMGKTDLKHRRAYKKALKDYEKNLPAIELENERRRQEHEKELKKLSLRRQAEEAKRIAAGLDPDALVEWKKGGGLKSKKYSKSLEATNRLFREHPLFEKAKKLSKKRIYDPSAYYFQDGGPVTPEEWEKEIRVIESQIGNPADWTMDDYYLLQDKLNAYRDWRENTPEGQAVIDSHNEEGEYDIPLPEHLQDYTNAMMKSKLAYANEFGNPAAKRMINIPDNPYDFGNGDTGTHYMSSMDNYAVPQIQDENGQLMLGDYGPDSREAMRFDSDEDANYFAEHYKDVSPGFMELELSDDEIQEYAKGGYIVEDISVPELNTYAEGGETNYQLGDEIDEATMKRLKKLGYTFEKI
jgi:hypothetical protein